MVSFTTFLACLTFTTVALGDKTIPPSTEFVVYYSKPGDGMAELLARRRKIEAALESKEWKSESRYSPCYNEKVNWGIVEGVRGQGNFEFATTFLKKQGWIRNDAWFPAYFDKHVVFTPE